MNVEIKLNEAGVDQKTIGILRDQQMLDGELLTEISRSELQGVCDSAGNKIPYGMVMKIKKAFPGSETAAVSPVSSDLPATGGAASSPVMKVVIAAAERRSDLNVITGVGGGVEADIEEARVRFGSLAFYVLTSDGKVDPAASLAAFKHFSEYGAEQRFANSEGESVPVYSLDEIASKDVDLDPLTLRPVLPGSAMAKTDAEVRLLIAFAVVTKVISAADDADQVIYDATERKFPKWQNAARDLEREKRFDGSDTLRQARRRLCCKSHELSSRSALCQSGSDGVRPRTAARELVVPAGRRLTGPQNSLLNAAILGVYSAGELKQDVLFELNEQLENIVSPGPFATVVFELVGWAERNQRTGDLINMVTAKNPSNSNVLALIRSLKS